MGRIYHQILFKTQSFSYHIDNILYASDITKMSSTVLLPLMHIKMVEGGPTLPRTTRKKSKNLDETDSQKLSPQDKQEIAEGGCVNCAVVLFIMTTITTLSILLL